MIEQNENNGPYQRMPGPMPAAMSEPADLPATSAAKLPAAPLDFLHGASLTLADSSSDYDTLIARLFASVRPSDPLEEIWTPANLERLARTYWRFLTRVTLGLIPVMLSNNDHGEINQILAPDLIYSEYFGWGARYRIFRNPSDDEKWSVIGGGKQHVEREFDAAPRTRERTPDSGAGIVGGPECTAGNAAHIIDQHVVILHALVCVAQDAIINSEQIAGFDDQSGFFPGFANRRFPHQFANFENTSGDRPLRLQRRVSALDQKYAGSFNDDRANAN